MSGAAINDQLWAEMTPAQKGEAVRPGRATLRQLVAEVLDGPAELRRICEGVLIRTDASLQQLCVIPGAGPEVLSQQELVTSEPVAATSRADAAANPPPIKSQISKKRRLGLPTGYLPRWWRREKPARATGAAASKGTTGREN